MLNIRPATPADAASIWSIIARVIRAGETYALDRDMTQKEALAYWMAPDKWTFVAEKDGVFLGAYYKKTNQAGGGSHVCNCGYITSEAARGRG